MWSRIYAFGRHHTLLQNATVNTLFRKFAVPGLLPFPIPSYTIYVGRRAAPPYHAFLRSASEEAIVDIRLLIGLLLALVAWPDEGPPPAAAVCALPLAAFLAALAFYGLAARGLLVALARRGAAPQRIALWHGRAMRLFGLLWLGGYGALLFLARWPNLAADWAPEEFWLAYRFVLLLPLLAALPVVWWGNFLSSRVLRRIPGLWPGAPAEAGLKFSHYLAFQIRHQLLVMLLPFVFVLGARDAVVFAAGGDASGEVSELAVSGAVVVVYLFSPLMMRLVWPVTRLAPGPLRGQLESAAARAGVRVADIFLWRTGAFMVNACLAGVIRPVRYVFLSEALARDFHPSQVEAVFGHELGHARYHHLAFYFLIALGGAVLAGLLAPLAGLLGGLSEDWLAAAVLIVYWGGFFGYLSRRFERQSDLAGARFVACPGESEPAACAYHQPTVELTESGRPEPGPRDNDLICPYQAWAFTSALTRLAALNGLATSARSWRHGSIAARVEFTSSMIGRPEAVRRYDRRLRRFKLFFCLLMLLAAGWLLAANFAAGFLSRP